MSNKKGLTVIIVILTILLFVVGTGSAYYIGKFKAEYAYLNRGIIPENIKNEDKGQNVYDKANNAEPVPQDLAKNITPISKDDHIRGELGSEIALIEYSDYQCSFCTIFHDTAKQIVEEYEGKLIWVYRHFPLEQMHSLAKPAAKASECVAELVGNDEFWNFSDDLYSREMFSEVGKSLLTEDKLKLAALSTGLNEEAYNNCMQDSKTAQKVDADFENGGNSGIRGTPGVILINIETGDIEVLPGAVPIEQLRQSIDTLLGE